MEETERGQRDEMLGEFIFFENLERKPEPKNVGSLLKLGKKKKRFFTSFHKEIQPCQHLDAKPMRPISDSYRIWR